MKKKTRSILIAVTVICVAVIGALTIRGISDKPPETEPSENAPSKIVYNDDTPDFTFKAKKETEFSSREDVYKEHLSLNREFEEFITKYENSWSDSKSDKNYDIYGEYLHPLYDLLEDKFSEKSDNDILSEKKDLIASKLSDLSDSYIFAQESADSCSDKTEKESYRNRADENERRYLEAKAYYKEYDEGKRTIDDVLSYLGIVYDETENPRYIPPEYYYN